MFMLYIIIKANPIRTKVEGAFTLNSYKDDKINSYIKKIAKNMKPKRPAICFQK